MGQPQQIPEAPEAIDILLEETFKNIPNDTRLLVCSMYENQKPLKGTAGALDWKLRGFLSRFMIHGRISGARDEIVYIPISRQSSMRHLLLVGLGNSDAEFGQAGDQIVKTLAKTVTSLNFKRVTISRSSFPFLTEATLKKALKGVEVEFVQ